MHDILVVILQYLLGARKLSVLIVYYSYLIGVVGMSQATQEFFRCFPPAWTAADHVQVSCDDIKIAQYCAHGHHSCRKINKPGVSLEKAENQTLCLNITNCSYDSQSCVANAFINYTKQEPNSFTVNVYNRSTSTPSDSGNNESHTDIIPPGGAGAIAAAVVLVVIIIGSMCILYWKVKCSRNAICGFCSPLHTCRIPPPDAVIEIGEGVL